MSNPRGRVGRKKGRKESGKGWENGKGRNEG